MKHSQFSMFGTVFTAVCLTIWALGGGVVFSQPADTPETSPAIHEDHSLSTGQGEVTERGIFRRDHRRLPKALAPSKAPVQNQTGSPPVVRDHRTQQGGTSSNTSTSTASLRGPSPPLGPPSAKQPVNDIGIDFLITNPMRSQIDDIVAQANASAAQQPSVRAKIKVESFRTFGAGLSATQFTDRPNHRFVRIPYMVGYKVYDVKKNVGGAWIPTTVTRSLSQSIGIHLFCDKWETGNGTIRLQTDIQPLYLENSQGTAEQIVDFFLNGHLTHFIDGLVRQQLNQISITDGAANLPFQCQSLTANQHQTPDPVDDTVDFNRPTAVLPTAQTHTMLNQVSVKFASLKRLPAKSLSGQILYNAVESPALEVYANFKHHFVPLPSIQEGQVIPLNIPAFSMPTPTGDQFLLILANVIQGQAIGSVPTDSAYRIFPKEGNFGNGTQILTISKSFWEPPKPPFQPKPTQHFRDAYELTVHISSGGQMTIDPGTGTTPTPGGFNPGKFNKVFQGTILKRGIEGDQSGEPATEITTEPTPAQPDPGEQSSGIKSH